MSLSVWYCAGAAFCAVQGILWTVFEDVGVSVPITAAGFVVVNLMLAWRCRGRTFGERPW